SKVPTFGISRSMINLRSAYLFLPDSNTHRNRLYPDAFTRSPRWRGEQRKRKGDSVNSLIIFLRLSLTWSRTRLNHIGSSRSGKAFGESKGGRGDPTFDAPTS